MIKAVVSDIEGTTSSLSFVKDVLFPYAREHIGDYVREHAQEAAMAALIEQVRAEAGRPLTLEQVVEQLVAWIDEDRKVTPLKTIQGMLWEAGYRSGAFKGHVYPDAAARLEAWHESGIKLYLYSSGSVQAQKLLFAHTDYGDLNGLFDGYFDTTCGAKNDSASYRRISETLGLKPEEILFLSDVESELDAAEETGMNTLWLVRDGVVYMDAAHRQVVDFNDIELC
jgi:enolase-phosphatase E1